MTANANPQLSTLPVEPNTQEIALLCAKHQLSSGEPGDLIEFMRALHENKLLAMKFWSVVAHMNPGQHSGGNPNWLLESIVEGVTAHTVDEVNASGPAYKLMVSRLSRMLAGEDVQGFELPGETVRPEQEVAPQRPRLVDPVTATPRKVAGTPNNASETAGPLRLILNPDPDIPVATAPEPTLPASDGPVLSPLFGYTQERTAPRARRKLWVVAIFAALLITLICVMARGSNSSIYPRLAASVRAGYTSAVASWQGHPSNGQKTPAPGNNNAIDAAIAPAPPLGNPGNLDRYAVAPRLVRPNRSITPAPEERPLKVGPAVHESASPPIGRIPAGYLSRDAPSLISGASLPVIPESAMRQNLISSRVPVYPEAARANHVGGLVLLQAVITREGSIGHLHFVQGDPQLRRAALDAVATWRYRPYLVNGQPTEVSTTISVNFPEAE